MNEQEWQQRLSLILRDAIDGRGKRPSMTLEQFREWLAAIPAAGDDLKNDGHPAKSGRRNRGAGRD